MRIYFANWWDNGYNSFFHLFIKKHIDNNIEFNINNPDIIICSVYGKRYDLIKYLYNNKDAITIFFTGECIKHPNHIEYNDHLLNTVDISIGFDEIENENYIRIPLWMIYETLNLNTINTAFKNIKNKNKFCCILSNHDKFNTRSRIFYKLNKYKKVDSGGKWNKNIKYKILDGENNKYKFLSPYKFNICCESMIETNYITEKIFESLLCGCIPVYLTNNKDSLIEPEILNQNIILKFTNNNIDDIIKKIILLDNNKEEYNKFINQDIFISDPNIVKYKKLNLLKELLISKYNKKKNFISGDNISSLCDISIFDKSYLINNHPCGKSSKRLLLVGTRVSDNINNFRFFFVKTDYLNYFKQEVLPKLKRKIILVTHNSDYSVGTDPILLNHPLIEKWYGQNMIKSTKTMGIPIGLENKCWKGWNYEICYNNYNNIKSNLLYLNFSLKTNKKRLGIMNLFLQKGYRVEENLSWELYIKKLSTYKYCISPLGNGVDCHRIWEAIYVGCVPIVEKHPILYDNFKELPIMFVNNYNNITNKYLEDEYHKFKDKNLDKSRLDYWKNILNNYK